MLLTNIQIQPDDIKNPINVIWTFNAKRLLGRPSSMLMTLSLMMKSLEVVSKGPRASEICKYFCYKSGVLLDELDWFGPCNYIECFIIQSKITSKMLLFREKSFWNYHDICEKHKNSFFLLLMFSDMSHKWWKSLVCCRTNEDNLWWLQLCC